jgi:hypothetical protein
VEPAPARVHDAPVMQRQADTTRRLPLPHRRPDASLLRRLAVEHSVDPRTIVRELDQPGSVRGLAGERARRAVAELRRVGLSEVQAGVGQAMPEDAAG